MASADQIEGDMIELIVIAVIAIILVAIYLAWRGSSNLLNNIANLWRNVENAVSEWWQRVVYGWPTNPVANPGPMAPGADAAGTDAQDYQAHCAADVVCTGTDTGTFGGVNVSN